MIRSTVSSIIAKTPARIQNESLQEFCILMGNYYEDNGTLSGTLDMIFVCVKG